MHGYKVGDKVFPFRKTICNDGSYSVSKSSMWNSAQYTGQDFLYYAGHDEDMNCAILNDRAGYVMIGDYFNYSDFRPFAEKQKPLTFEINGEMLERLLKWQGKSEESSHSDHSKYEYLFVPSSFGLITKVRNTHTGQIIDLSDYDKW